MNENKPNDFEQAGQESEMGLMQEFFQLIKENRKFWLIPLILILLAIGLLIVLGGTAAAPFIYTLF